MNLLVTGGSGFIGVNLLERLLAQGHRVTAVSADDLPQAARSDFASLQGKLETVQADVRDEDALERLLAQSRAEAVLAGAAITAGPARERESPGAIFDVNLGAVARLIALAGRHGVRRLVALSSSAALGDRLFGDRPATEDDPPQPATIYGITKAALELLQRRWSAIAPGSPQVAIARVSAVFGPWERATGVRDVLSPPYQMARAAARRESMAPLPGGGDRDWVYAPYLGRALEWMLLAPRLDHALYNVGAGCTWHPRVFAAALADAGLPVEEAAGAPAVTFSDDLSRRRTCLDVRRITGEFGPPPAPEAAAEAYAAWVSAHRGWFQ